MDEAVMAVDVGTRSARAALFSRDGRMHGRTETPIKLHTDGAGAGEYESEDIWSAVCSVAREALDVTGLDPLAVKAIAFDATCSLVVRGMDGASVAVTPGCDPSRDTICWLDHRAVPQAEFCTQTGHPILSTVGGAMPPEMQLPKLIWLKTHCPEVWAQLTGAWDLTDFLSWRASGSTARSVCTTAAKWAWTGRDRGWPDDFHRMVGLDDVRMRAALPDAPVPVGEDLGPLTDAAASDLGLTPQCRVGAGLVDAFAGTLGMVPSGVGANGTLAMTAGTSTCIMGLTDAPVESTSVWGPSPDAIIPGNWVFEAGQSATGALLERIMSMFGKTSDSVTHARIGSYLDTALAREGDAFGAGLHIVPDFHGNRSPFADPLATGVISGLTLDASFDALCRTYWRGCVGLALSLRQIIEHLRADGIAVQTLHLTGGHTRLDPFPQLYADATGCPVRICQQTDAVLLGTAIAAARAAGWGDTLPEIADNMPQETMTLMPASHGPYESDYRVFRELQDHRRSLDGRAVEAPQLRRLA